MIAISILVLLYIIIFCFSEEDGESSSALSSRVTGIIWQIYHKIMGNGTKGGVPQGAALPLEGLIRKLAHFVEYLCVGFVSYSLVVMWHKPAGLGSLAVVIQLALSAGLDEFHQSFIPGRYASVGDVMIDVAGGVMGMMLLAVWVKMVRRRRSNV